MGRPSRADDDAAVRALLEPVVATGCLPDDIAAALSRAMRNPAAATCSDRALMLALARYDRPQDGLVRVEELPTGGLFCLGAAGGARLGGRVFRRGRRIRTRYQCFESRTGREYRVHALSRVELVVVPAVTVTRTLSAADFAAGISGSASRPGRRRPSGARLRLP